MTYLLIENPVDSIPSIDLLITLGASSSRGTDRIGQFGSGFPYSLALLAREGLLTDSKICLGKDVYTFLLEESKDKTSRDSDFAITKIVMKKQNGGRYPLNISTEFGAIDWHGVGMALRELISNAYDGSDDPNTVKVDESSNSRAKDGTIRIYIPMSEGVREYHNDISKYFLMNNYNYKPDQQLLKNNCQHGTRFYRRGVLVGEFDSGLFDYNLNDIDLKESRIVDSWEAITVAGNCILNGSIEDIALYLRYMHEETPCYESRIESSQLSVNNWRFTGNAEIVKERWRKAYSLAFGNKIPCRNRYGVDCLSRKGYSPIHLDEKLYKIVSNNGIATDKNILNSDELEGKAIESANTVITDCLELIWLRLDELGLVNGRSIPSVKIFSKIMDSGTMTLGYYKEGIIYVNKDISESNTFMLRQTVLEEIGHHVTGATDNSRDFQDWAFRVTATLL